MEALSININTVSVEFGWKIWFLQLCHLVNTNKRYCIWMSICISGLMINDQYNWHSMLEAQGLSPGLQFIYSNENVFEHN